MSLLFASALSAIWYQTRSHSIWINSQIVFKLSTHSFPLSGREMSKISSYKLINIHNNRASERRQTSFFLLLNSFTCCFCAIDTLQFRPPVLLTQFSRIFNTQQQQKSEGRKWMLTIYLFSYVRRQPYKGKV